MPLLRSPLLQARAFRHAFPTRDTPDAELGALLECDVASIVQVRQVHGAQVVVVPSLVVPGSASGSAPGWTLGSPAPRGERGSQGRQGEAPEGDAIVARGRHDRTAVGIRVADCVPVLVADEGSGDVAAIHAGWRGVVAGVVPAAIAALLATDGGGAGRLIAAIGPCIGACCFEVGRDVAARIGFVAREAGDKAYVDLRAAVRAQLRAAGLESEHIEDVPGCTKHEPDRFHSFRRDGADSGRMLAVIAPIRMD